MTGEKKTIGVGILGGTGYGAGELLRLLIGHPHAEVVSVCSHSKALKLICQTHSHLLGFYPQKFDAELNLDALKNYQHKLVFCALPHGESALIIAKHQASWQKMGIRCIDLSGDFRIQDHHLHQHYYPSTPLLPKLRGQAVYGWTEYAASSGLANATLVANPGCLATAALISLMPTCALAIQPDVMIHVATGSSGSGKNPKDSTHHPTRHANLYAYKRLDHRHMGEIIAAFQHYLGQDRLAKKPIQQNIPNFYFMPHSLPVSRGIFCTTFLKLQESYTQQSIDQLVRPMYEKHPFLRVRAQSPQLQDVVGSHFADISLAVKANTLVVSVVLDNLIKGMAGQAIANMNVMCALPQKTGLWFASPRPI